MAYEGLAEIYDCLMTDTDYNAWADYIDQLLQQYNCPGNQILDLGCGTGNISIPLIQKGWQMIGVDNSEEMLMRAAEKCYEAEVFMPLLQQDITDLELSFQADGAIATFDTFNYILEPADLYQVFEQLGKVMVSNGLLIFDINTPYKLKAYLGENTFTYHSEDVTYLWENYYDSENEICEMYLTFFVRDDATKLYRKMEEIHYQKVYQLEQLSDYLAKAGFELLAVFNQLENQPIATLDQEEKVVLIARKIVKD